MQRILMVVFVVLIALPQTAFAQSSEENFNPCTDEELDTIREISQVYRPLYSDLSQEFQDIPSESYDTDSPLVDELIFHAADLQYNWWTNAVPIMPECSLGLDTKYTVGRLLDSTLIAFLLLDSSRPKMADTLAISIQEAGRDWSAIEESLGLTPQIEA